MASGEESPICNMNDPVAQEKAERREFLKNAIAENKRKLNILESECQEKTEYGKELKRKVEAKSEDIATLKLSLGNNLKEIKEKNTNKLKRYEEIQAAKKKKEESKKKEQECAELKKAEAKKEKTEEMSKESLELIEDLNKKIDEIKNGIDIINTKIEEKTVEISNVSKHRNNLIVEKDGVSQEKNKIEETVKELKEKSNNILKQKNEDEKSRLDKTGEHAEKGNALFAELHDARNIMQSNLSTVKTKFYEVQRKVALKKLELAKLKESHATLLFDLRKKNHSNGSVCGVIQKDIEDHKEKIMILQKELKELLSTKIEGYRDSEDGLSVMNAMVSSSLEDLRTTIGQNYKICDKTFEGKENVFNLENEFRLFKSQLKELRNKLSLKNEELENIRKGEVKEEILT